MEEKYVGRSAGIVVIVIVYQEGQNEEWRDKIKGKRKKCCYLCSCPPRSSLCQRDRYRRRS